MDLWPPLPFEAWNDTRETVHRWAQIVGKIQLALTPTVNHWWNVPLQLTARGFATEMLQHGDRSFDLELDFFDDVLRLRVTDGSVRTIALAGSVSSFYTETMAMMRAENLEVQIWPVPVEIDDHTRFDRDSRHIYDKQYALRFWRILSEASAVLEKYRAGFVGKSSPVQFYWGHMDLSQARFSGRRALVQTTDPIEREAYSHELFSVGWWAGDGRLTKPAFYSYAAPEPPGFSTAPIATEHAYYHAPLHCFQLDYDDVRAASDPEALILDFCSSTYAAAADLGHWDRAALERETDVKGAA